MIILPRTYATVPKKLVFTNFLLWEKDHITKKQIQSAILTYIPMMQI